MNRSFLRSSIHMAVASIVLMFMAIAPVSQATDTNLIVEDWEGGSGLSWSTNWDLNNGVYVSSDTSAHCGRNQDDLVSPSLDLSGYDEFTLSFYFRDDDIDDADDMYLQFWDGSAYDNIVELGTTSPEDTWHYYEQTFENSGGEAQYFINGFALKFEGTSLDFGENIYIDDIVLVASTSGGSAPGAASSPSPSDSATGVSTTADLSWTAGSGATSHDVYFDTSSPPAFVQNQAGTSYDPGTLSLNTTYYWRIDEKNSNGTTTGTVWSFTTASSVSPVWEDDLEGVSSLLDLFPSDASGFTQLQETNGGECSLETTIVHSGSNSVKCYAPASGNPKADLGREDLRDDGYPSQIGPIEFGPADDDEFWSEQWFYVTDVSDFAELYLWDIEESDAPGAGYAGLRIQGKNNGTTDYIKMNSEFGSSFEPDTPVVTFPVDEWVRLRIYIKFHTSTGVVKIWQNDTLVLDETGQTSRTSTSVYDTIQWGATVNASGTAQTVYFDDVKYWNEDPQW